MFATDMARLTVKGVFFDLFGTLLVYGDMRAAWSGWLTSFHASLRAHGLSLSEDIFAQECERFFGQEEPPRGDNNSTVFERRIDRLCARLGLSIGLSEITRIADHIVAVWHEHVQLDPDAEAVLHSVGKSKTLALVSNFDHPPHVRRTLMEYRLTGCFESIVISGEVGVKKPDPRIFAPALSQTGLQPTEVAYVGDTEEDVAAARSAGMIPVLIQRGSSGTDTGALDFTRDASDQLREGVSEHGTDVTRVASLRELIKLFG